MKKLILVALLLSTISIFAQKNKFIWGVASASYQVEGAYKADGKGESNWDVYTNTYEITKKTFTKTNQTGNVSVNQYDRKQYLKDFALMKKLGVTHYRFSLSWARMLPDGVGKINQKGVAHYQQFIDDLLSFSIEPCITLYHWDLPQKLQVKGGWNNPKSVDWYVEYSNLVFKSFGKKVKYYITFNEPNIDLFLITTAVNNVLAGKNAFATTTQDFANQAPASYNLCVANALATNNYHLLKLGGQIGITLNLIPTIPKDANNPKDVAAAELQDGIHNRWFLDPALKGTFPADVLEHYKKSNVNIAAFEPTVKNLPYWKSDFIGVNFYSPAYVTYDDNFPNSINWQTNNPDTIPMFNGVVKPAYLYKLLMRLKNDYNNPSILITENGAGFGDRDEKFINGVVNDSLRTDYVKRHISAALQAKKDGARLEGYFLWSILDNFEWIFGYDRRFGIVYVDFETQKRTPKKSFYEYQKIIKTPISLIK